MYEKHPLKKSKHIGSLWKGDKGLTGDLDLWPLGQYRIGVFENTHKKSDSEPDYRIVVLPEKDTSPF
ncbi:hypothetical protein [Candidatus Magnetominusculus dajiuhuensis]|uniref:hypothetical protein n=1 Tax=Candidatus Magnetominusculus dajiuhuensis TaxID=3137712 RepID=UPI003B43887B